MSAPDVTDADFVLVGHGHFGHAADAVAVAEASDASIVAVAGLATQLAQQSEAIKPILRNPSTPLDLGTGVEVGLVEMDHSSSTGLHGRDIEYTGVLWFVLNDGDHTVFYADDTGICANLK